jgi:hypothetical protein
MPNATRTDPLTFRLMRHPLGGLGLLHATDNTSVGDMPYAEKIEWYRRNTSLLMTAIGLSLSPLFIGPFPTCAPGKNLPDEHQTAAD